MAGENLVRPKGFKAWCANYWYHYKYHTIVALVLLITAAITIAQCSTRTKYDYEIVVATETVFLTGGQLDSVKEQLEKYGDDLNGDGEVNVLLIDCTFNKKESDYESYNAKQQKLQTLLMNDTDVMLFITDPQRLEWINALGKTDFIANTGLPHHDGKAYILNNTPVLEDAKKSFDPENKYDWGKQLLISRRTIEGTLFENRKGVETKVKNADALIQKIINNQTSDPAPTKSK